MDKKTFDEQFARGVKAGARAQQTEPRARSASYDAGSDRLTVEMTNGATFIIPRSLIQGLAAAEPAQVAEVKVMPRGAALHWEGLDVQMSVPAMIAGVFGTRAWMSELGRRAGSVTSEAKADAVRENGRKGGRPRQKKTA